jgi:hypothetical protein
MVGLTRSPDDLASVASDVFPKNPRGETISAAAGDYKQAKAGNGCLRAILKPAANVRDTASAGRGYIRY